MDGTKCGPPTGPPFRPHSREKNNGFHSDVVKLQGLLNFYLKGGEDDVETNIFSSFQFHDIFHFENTAIVSCQSYLVEKCNDG